MYYKSVISKTKWYWSRVRASTCELGEGTGCHNLVPSDDRDGTEHVELGPLIKDKLWPV